MVSEIESPLDDAVLDDEDVVVDEPTDEVDTEDSVESLRADINALKAQLERPSWLNELKTIEGRVRSAEARLQRAVSKNLALLKQLQKEREAKPVAPAQARKVMKAAAASEAMPPE